MKFRQLGSILIVLSLWSVFLAGCDKEQAQTEKTQALPTAIVAVERVSKRIAANQVEIVGTVQAVEQAKISSKISGNIVTLPVHLGSRVQKDDLLVELRAGEIFAQVQQAKTHLEQAERNLAREEKLLKKNAATSENVSTLRETARIASGAYQEALTMLNYSKITAPFTGIITRKLANIGDLATPGTPLLYLEEENNLQVLTDIPEAMILRIQKDDRLSIYVPSVDLTVEGRVAEVSPTADPASRTAPIKLKIRPNPQLRSGQFARVTIVKDQQETLTIPGSAIVPFGQMERVFVVVQDRAYLRLVRIGATDNGYSEILSGLSENEVVITKSNQNLLDGQPVTIQ